MIKKFLSILLLIGFVNCSSSQKAMKLQEEVPFKTESIFAQTWTAGQKDGGSGINVQLTITNLDTETIVLKDFYFRGRKTELQDASTNTNGLYVAYFVNPTEKEVILHENHKKEAGNEPPQLHEKIPFKLATNEGVISYSENGILKYFKVINIIEKLPIYYPSAPENKQ